MTSWWTRKGSIINKKYNFQLLINLQVTEYEEKNSRLALELKQAKGEMVAANLSSAQLGKTIVRLR